MRTKKGGTDMWCPGCSEICTCKAVPAAEVTEDTEDYKQRWHKANHPDVNWFQRGRECLSCGHLFVTAEVDIDFIDELVELRDALTAIKSNAEAYIRESEAASDTLGNLTQSLSLLRALRLYQEV